MKIRRRGKGKSYEAMWQKKERGVGKGNYVCVYILLFNKGTSLSKHDMKRRQHIEQGENHKSKIQMNKRKDEKDECHKRRAM